MATSAESAFSTQLQKALKGCSELSRNFKETVDGNKSSLTNMKNLEEQYSCCNKVDLKRTAFSSHPDVKDRVMTKIQLLLENHVKQLRESLSTLETIAIKVSKSYHTTFDLYQRRRDELDIRLMTQRNVMWPSLADMLQMLEDLDHSFHFQYVRRWHHIQELDYADPDTLENLTNVWLDTKSLEETVQVTLGTVHYFLETKL